MVADPRLDQLLLRWEELHEQGTSISAEELCRDTPELIGELSRRIRDLEFMDGLLGPSPEAQADWPTQTGDGTETPGDSPRHLAGDEDTRKLFASLTPPQDAGELGRLGAYRILKVLGAGGMGVVFQAEDSQLKRPVALKLMKPSLAASDSARQRFLREAQAAAALEHEHIVPIYQVGAEGNVPFLAMPGSWT
jgi:hypothetical protein